MRSGQISIDLLVTHGIASVLMVQFDQLAGRKKREFSRGEIGAATLFLVQM
jgi:hypothetical protein